MSSHHPIPRPPSRSERLLRDTLRKDDTLRTQSRPRSTSSTCDEDDEDDIFQSAILFRCSSRRNSAASALAHAQPTGFYIPDHHEQASYSCLLRSSSHSGSSRSGRSDGKSPPDELLRHHDAAPHEAVPCNRLDSVMHSMRIDQDRDSSSASLPSSLGSTTHSHESHQTHLTMPDPDPCVAYRTERSSPRGHRHTQSTSAMNMRLPSPHRTSTPRVPTQSPPPSHWSPQGLRSPPRTPTCQEKDRLKRLHPDSPWMYAPLPPSPPAYSTSPSKRSGPAVVTFVATPPLVDRHATRSPARHSPNSTFDPDAASHALRQLPGYVSFASVAGLDPPPEEEDKRGARRPFASFTLGGGKGRLSGLGLGSGKWWMF